MALTDGPASALGDVPLASRCTLGVGGRARWLVRATTTEVVAEVDRWCAESHQPLFVLGGGSNLVVADGGFDGVVLQPAMTGMTFAADGDEVLLSAGAGETWDACVAAAVTRGLIGLESLSGIPGHVGGTPIQNVGAYGQDVAETIECVGVFDRETRRTRTLLAGECGFAYRMSRFKGVDAGRFVVCDVTFRVRRGPPSPRYPDVLAQLSTAGVGTPTVALVRAAVLAVRRRKGMVLDPADSDTRSVGSFFVNPIVTTTTCERVASLAGTMPPAYEMGDGRVKVPAAWLIERAGIDKGLRDGAAGVSSKHPLALVNRGGATAADIVRLARRVKGQVVDRFGVWLRPEPIFVGFHEDPGVDYLQRTDD